MGLEKLGRPQRKTAGFSACAVLKLTGRRVALRMNSLRKLSAVGFRL